MTVAAPAKFIFDGVNYELEKAEISGFLTDPNEQALQGNGRVTGLGWMLECQARKRITDDGDVAPRIEINMPVPIADWHELAAAKLKWSSQLIKGRASEMGLPPFTITS